MPILEVENQAVADSLKSFLDEVNKATGQNKRGVTSEVIAMNLLKNARANISTEVKTVEIEKGKLEFFGIKNRIESLRKKISNKDMNQMMMLDDEYKAAAELEDELKKLLENYGFDFKQEILSKWGPLRDIHSNSLEAKVKQAVDALGNLNEDLYFRTGKLTPNTLELFNKYIDFRQRMIVWTILGFRIMLNYESKEKKFVKELKSNKEFGEYISDRIACLRNELSQIIYEPDCYYLSLDNKDKLGIEVESISDFDFRETNDNQYAYERDYDNYVYWTNYGLKQLNSLENIG